MKIYEGVPRDHYFPTSFVELPMYQQAHIIAVRERYFHTCMLPSLGFEVGQLPEKAEERKLNSHFSFRNGGKKTGINFSNVQLTQVCFFYLLSFPPFLLLNPIRFQQN